MRHLLISLFPVLLIASACNKTESSELFSPIPEISLLSVSPLQVQAFKDSVVFTIAYADGDGDMGTSQADEKNIFIVDQRIDITHGFRLATIVPNDAAVPIQGTIRVTLPNTLITDSSPQQEVIFTVYVVDRAGNESNRVDSPTLTVSQ